MVMQLYNIPVSMLRQYCFCPRIPYFYLVRNLKPFEQPWVKQGTKEHIRQQLLMRRRNFSRFNINCEGMLKVDVELYSEHLNLHGICDAVIETAEEVAILEFKNSPNYKISMGTKVQIAAYAMLYEEQFNKSISKGFVLYGIKGKTFEINIDSELRQKTLNIRDSVFDIIEKCYIPDSSANESKCSQCEFFNFCADRF